MSCTNYIYIKLFEIYYYPKACKLEYLADINKKLEFIPLSTILNKNSPFQGKYVNIGLHGQLNANAMNSCKHCLVQLQNCVLEISSAKMI